MADTEVIMGGLKFVLGGFNSAISLLAQTALQSALLRYALGNAARFQTLTLVPVCFRGRADSLGYDYRQLPL